MNDLRDVLSISTLQTRWYMFFTDLYVIFKCNVHITVVSSHYKWKEIVDLICQTFWSSVFNFDKKNQIIFTSIPLVASWNNRYPVNPSIVHLTKTHGSFWRVHSRLNRCINVKNKLKSPAKQRNVSSRSVNQCQLGSLLLTWFNFSLSMDK